MKVPGSKIVPCQGVLGSNHSLTFCLFTQVSSSGPLGPLVLDLIVFVYALCYGFGRIKFVYIQRYIVIFNKMLV